MDWGMVLLTLLGITIILLALSDAFFTTMHPDINGAITSRLQRGIWWLTTRVARAAPGMQRNLFAIAGPAMLALTFITWILLFILGFALVAWPHLRDKFDMGPQHTVTLWDAVYYSGSTATVLGFGDIVPLTPVFQVLAIVESGFGFLLFGSSVTYLFRVLSGIMTRNEVTLRVLDASGGTGDGAQLVARHATHRNMQALPDELRGLTDDLRRLQLRMQRYPILTFYYRSTDPAFDPERLFHGVLDAALAARMLSRSQDAAHVRTAAEDLDVAFTRFIQIVARREISSGVARKLESTQPTAEDRAYAERVRERLDQALEHQRVDPGTTHTPEVLDLAYRGRVFMAALTDLTGWRPGSGHAPAQLTP